jgi:hypothetical protein
MHPQVLLLRALFALLACICLASSAIAQDTLLINYQGRLTDDNGDPITGTPSMTFVIYDGGGISKWSETHPSVQVDDGLFSVILGSAAALPDSVFNGDDRYLGIAVGGDPEISPRTLLTSAPGAVYAKRLAGDMITTPGMLVLNSEDGDSAIVLQSSTSRSLGASIKMFNPQPEPPARLVEMNITEVGDPAEWKSSFSMFLAEPPDEKEIFSISSSPSIGASIKMFNPQPEPPAILFELNANATDGASMNIYDDIGQVMGFEPSPFNGGYSIKLMDPGADEKLAEMNSSYGAKGGSGEVAVYDSDNSLESHLTPAKLVLQHSPGMIAYPPIFLDATSVDDPKIGIGTDTPSEPLVIGNNLAYYPGNMLVVGNNTPDSYAGLALGEDEDNRFYMCYDNSNDYVYMGSKIGGVYYSNNLVLRTGKVGIGINSPSEELHVVGDICYTGTIGTCSDRRYKKNIAPIPGALEKISRLRGVKFNWNQDGFPENRFSDEEQVGLIAQEVMEVFPQVVSQDDNGYYNIDYTKFAPLLINAVKELKAENEELRRRIEALEKR